MTTDSVLFGTSMKQISLLATISTVFSTCLISCADPPTDPPLATVGSISAPRSVGKQRVVAFPEVRDETSGTAAEHAWIHAEFPGYQWISRELLEDRNGRTYHRVTMADSHGRRATVYFDVTEWFDRL